MSGLLSANLGRVLPLCVAPPVSLMSPRQNLGTSGVLDSADAAIFRKFGAQVTQIIASLQVAKDFRTYYLGLTVEEFNRG